MRLPGPWADPVAPSQARINEFAAAVIRTAPWDPRQAQAALKALCELNWAAGFDFEGVPPGPPGASREYHAGMAARHLWGLEVSLAWEKRWAEIQAETRARFGHAPEEAAALLRRSKAPSTPALVYVVTHPALGAVKVGVSDADGERIAAHRRAGWQLAAAFRVTARAAAVIEAGVLDWWRRGLGLPAYLSREQMPQGGWTETAAAGSIDLAATVTRICAQAASPEAWPATPSLTTPARRVWAR
jgi:hypothetical protein